MNKKRGLIFVVLVLVLLLFVLAENGEEPTDPPTDPTTDPTTPSGLGTETPAGLEDVAEWEDCAWFGSSGFYYSGCLDESGETLTFHCQDIQQPHEGDWDAGECENKIDSGITYLRTLQKIDRGCAVATQDDDDDTSGDDDCSVAILPAGYIFHKGELNYDGSILATSAWEFDEATNTIKTDSGYNEYKDGEDYDGAYCHNEIHELDSSLYGAQGASWICAPDTNWLLCDISHNGATVWGDAEEDDYNVYQCTCVDNSCDWISSDDTDQDRDGYLKIADNDCDDDPTDDPIDARCAELYELFEEVDFIGQPREAIQATLTANCNGDPAYGQCAICTHPGAPEICGDFRNNDCRGDGNDKGDLNNRDGDTSDFCNKNRDSCQVQHTRGPDLEPGIPLHNNIYGLPFSWVDTEDGGHCCGFNGLDDLGRIEHNSDGNYLCVSQDSSLVGAEKSVETIVQNLNKADTDQEITCTGDWCWLNAASTSEESFIYSIQHPDQTYDVVSNGQKWIECRGTEGTNQISSKSTLTNSELIIDANRFYCYQNGETWNWADCRDPGALAQAQNGIKDRIEGDGLFALHLDTQGSQISHYKQVPPLFRNFYDQNPIDFSAFTHLELYVRFTSTIKHPAYVNLQINGPEFSTDTGSSKLPYYDQNILGFAVNNPILEKQRWIHLKVKIPEMLDVSEIKFESINNPIEIRNVYFSNVKNNNICSGESATLNDESAWLTDLDYLGNEINGERLCNTLFDPNFNPGDDPEKGNAWLGDEEIPIAADRCCGNNENEYTATEDIGCWNSEFILPKSTVMNVEFQVKSQFQNWDIKYDDEPFDVTLEKELLFVDDLGEDIGFVCPSESEVLLDLASTAGVLPEELEAAQDHIEGIDDSGELSEEAQDSLAVFINLINNECQSQIYEVDTETCSVTYERTLNVNIPDLDTEIPGFNDNVPKTVTTSYPCNTKFTGSTDSSIPSVAEAKDVGSEHYNGNVHVQELDRSFNLKLEPTTQTFPDNKISLKTSPQEIARFEVDFRNMINPLANEVAGSLKVTTENPKVKVYFVNQEMPLGEPDIIASIPQSALHLSINNLIVMAKLTEEYEPIVTHPSSQKTNTETYSCQEKECIYPLPGDFPYRITNLHPELYDMYFVAGNTDKDRTLITKKDQKFDEPGNILVTNIAQQVIYDNDEIKFWGCQAADYIVTGSEAENVPFCSVKANQYCAYSADFNTVNSWSGEVNKHIEYILPENPQPGESVAYKDITGRIIIGEPEEETPEELTSPDEDATTEEPEESTDELPDDPATGAAFVGAADTPPEEDVQEETSILVTSGTVPARNILPNAEWTLDTEDDLNKIKFWNILKNGATKKLHKDNVEGTTLTLKSKETLISDRIAIPLATNLHFSQEFDCKPTITLLDVNDNSKEANLPEFNTGEFTHLRIEFKGTCEINNPLLQFVDEQGPAEFNYHPTDEINRAGVACCAPNTCWNGFACAPEMSDLSHLSEHIEEGRDYRCIQGQWKYLPVKLDWNNQNKGFCAEESECFVTSTATGDNPSSLTFTSGEFPVCIKDGEFILDHYCQEGKWTSRTKFLSQSLVQAAADLDDEFVIYCSTPENTLLDMEFKNNFILGEFPVTLEGPATTPLAEPELDTEAEGEPPLLVTAAEESQPTSDQIFTCFNALADEQGQRLIPPRDNTCINNVCILRHKKSGVFTTAFATTLNKPASEAGSFVQALDLAPEVINEKCTGTKKFVKCKDLPIEGDLYYSADLNAIIYGKDGFDLEPGFFTGVVNFFKNLFGDNIDLKDEETFLNEAEVFDEIYLLNTQEKEIRAVREAPGIKETLVAEYEGFKTPLCDYVDNRQAPTDKELLILSGEGPSYTCEQDETIQKFITATDTDFWWQEMTGKLRVK